jgi:hypothetical protein
MAATFRRRSPLRSTTIVPLALLLALLLATPAQAALNGSRPYHASHPYLVGLGGPEFILASGELDAALPGTQGSFGFFSARGADLDGLSKVCWSEAVARRCQSGALSLHVAAGGSFGLRVPGGADASVHAAHALALFSDLGTTSDLNGLGLGKSLLAPSVGGEARLSAMAPIPDSSVSELSDGGGALAPLALGTVVEVRDAGGAVVATVHGKSDPLTFAGHPSLSPVAADLLVVPFAGTGADAHFRQASPADAREGLDFDRINGLFRLLSDADSSGQAQPGQVDESAFGPFQDAAATLFAGAVLRMPTDGNASSAASSFGYARTPRLEVKGTPSGGLAWSGRATLEVRGGHVVGGPALYGWAFVALPWWGWVLWALGIAALVTRLVMKPPKRSERWDRWKWIGWLVGAVAAIVVFVLWDGELRHVLGLSLLTMDWSFSGAGAQVLALVAVFQFTTLGYLSFSAIAPLRLLLKNGSRLLGQGTFMGLTGAIAALLGYLIGFSTLRSSLDLVVSTVLKGIGG